MGQVNRRRFTFDSLEVRENPAMTYTAPVELIADNALAQHQRVLSGDFNHDGRSNELLFWSPNSVATYFQTDSRGGAGRLQAFPGRGALSPNNIDMYFLDDAVVGDFDRDGRVNDVLTWSTTGNTTAVYYGNSTGGWSGGGAANLGFAIAPGSKILVGDFDQDGFRSDLFVYRISTGENKIAVKGRSASSWSVTGTPIATSELQGAANVVAGDLDYDGVLDDLFVMQTNGQNVLVLSSGTTYTSLSNTIDPSLINRFDRITLGDYDGDGATDDLLFRSVSTGMNKIAYGRATGIWTTNRLGNSISPSMIAGYDQLLTLDLDGNGKRDDLFGWRPGKRDNFVSYLRPAGPLPDSAGSTSNPANSSTTSTTTTTSRSNTIYYYRRIYYYY